MRATRLEVRPIERLGAPRCWGLYRRGRLVAIVADERVARAVAAGERHPDALDRGGSHARTATA